MLDESSPKLYWEKFDSRWTNGPKPVPPKPPPRRLSTIAHRLVGRGAWHAVTNAGVREAGAAALMDDEDEARIVDSGALALTDEDVIRITECREERFLVSIIGASFERVGH